jgi:hypothetical protein
MALSLFSELKSKERLINGFWRLLNKKIKEEDFRKLFDNRDHFIILFKINPMTLKIKIKI